MTKKNTILVADDSALNIAALKHILQADYEILSVCEGSTCIKTARSEQPDLILLDIIMPGMNGFEVLTNLKTNAITKAIPVIIITAPNHSEEEERGLQLGAADFISKPFSSSVVRLRVRNQIQIVNQTRYIHDISTKDELTGIGNRRYFCDQLEQEWNRAMRNRTHLSCMKIDIDGFKAYNDLYGHLQGDRALKIVAQSIKASLTRAVDKVTRWGSDGFSIILPDTEPSGAHSVAERIRRNIEAVTIPLPDGTPSRVNISIGIHCLMPNSNDGYTQTDFISDMDKSLQQAKKKKQIYTLNEGDKL